MIVLPVHGSSARRNRNLGWGNIRPYNGGHLMRIGPAKTLEANTVEVADRTEASIRSAHSPRQHHLGDGQHRPP